MRQVYQLKYNNSKQICRIHCICFKFEGKQASILQVREEFFAVIVTDMAYLKHFLSRRTKFERIVEIVPDSYLDELEARLPTWNPVAFDLTHKNKWAR